MTTDLLIEEPTQAADAAASWDQGVKALDPNKDDPPPQQNEQSAAPSTEGVVTSEAEENAKDEQAADTPKQKLNLGGLSTKDLIAFALDPDADPVDKERALRLRAARMEQSPQSVERQKRVVELRKEQAVFDQVNQKKKQEYPDIHEIEQPEKDIQRQKLADEIQIEERRIADEKDSSAIQFLNEKYPNFFDVRDSGDFIQWASVQPQNVKDFIARGGVVGADAALGLYDDFVRSQGKPSPFVSLKTTAPAPVPTDASQLQSEAMRIVERRQQILRNSAAIPSGARSSLPTPESDAASAWNAGVALVNQSKRN